MSVEIQTAPSNKIATDITEDQFDVGPKRDIPQSDMAAAELLLSVSPMFKPCQPARDRTWSLQSLETLVDVAVATRPTFTIGPSVSAKQNSGKSGVKKKLKRVIPASKVKGRSLLQTTQGKKLPRCSCGKVGCSKLMAKTGMKRSRVLTLKTKRVVKVPVTGGVRIKSEGYKTRMPYLLPTKLKQIYFKDGRIGIYTKPERRAMISKFVEKRAKRVWTKKVRYSCRKNLAKQRLRVKGRFVKSADLVPKEENEESN